MTSGSSTSGRRTTTADGGVVRSGREGGGGSPGPDAGRELLLQRYRQLVLHDLPAAGRAGGWVVTLDHCFGRIVLDTVLGRCWYVVLDRRRPAFRQLTGEQLAAAVALGERLQVEGDPLLRRLNDESLRMRGKRS